MQGVKQPENDCALEIHWGTRSNCNVDYKVRCMTTVLKAIYYLILSLVVVCRGIYLIHESTFISCIVSGVWSRV